MSQPIYSRRKPVSFLVFFFTLVIAAGSITAASAVADRAIDPAAIDAVAASFYKEGVPGAAILVAEGDQVVLEKGYGLASLELGVPIAPDMVFRIGSVTKQFTAVAILMLEEQGKLRLDQKISEILPDYPKAQGEQVSIEQLLNHTGGIPNYTDDPEFWKFAKDKVEPARMLALFADKPLGFKPGEQWAYSNSGYFVLGLILEKVSGESYRDFVEKRLLAPAGMKASLYDDPEKLVPRHATGYQPMPGGGFAPAPYIDMSGPYSAGALASTLGDLHRWNLALLEGKLISRKSLEKAWSPRPLAGGKKNDYGFGWGVGMFEGQRMVSHGGGIPGFMSFLIFLPERKMTVAVLSNGAALSSEHAAQRVLMAAFGNGEGYKRITLPAESLAKLEGVYQIDATSKRVVKVEGDHLITIRDGGAAFTAYPIGENEFAYEHNNNRLRFELDGQGKVARMQLLTWGQAEGEPAERTGEKIPEGPKFVELSAEELDRLTGNFELHPGFVLNIRREGQEMIAQATGQGPIGIKATSPTELFSQEVGARIVFELEGGKAKSLTLFQGGAEMPAKRVD
jgi:D-alanyl-D-alanine carboxypeptidase